MAGTVAVLGGLWVLVALVLVLHFVLYFQVPLSAALKWGTGDALLWVLLLVVCARWQQARSAAANPRTQLALLFGVAICCGLLLHPLLSTLLFWAIDDAISRPFWEDVAHLALKRLPQGLLGGLIIAMVARWAGSATEPPATAQTTAAAPWPGPLHVDLQEGQRTHRVTLATLDWIEAAGNYVELHQADGSQVIRSTLSALVAELEPHGFLRISRKHLINLHKVEQFVSKSRGARVLLKSGVELPVSRSAVAAVRQALGDGGSNPS